MCIGSMSGKGTQNMSQKQIDKNYTFQQKGGMYDAATGAATGKGAPGMGIRFDQTTAGKAANNPTGSAVAQAGTILGAAPLTTPSATNRRKPGTSTDTGAMPGQNTLLGG